MSLADSLEAAAEALADDADSIRPANGDPRQLLSLLAGPGAVRVMTWLLVNEPDAASELATGWLADQRGAEPLLQISEQGLPKPGRKVLRRALHQLRSRGVETPRAAPSARVAKLPAVDDDIEAAYVTALDPRGSQLVFMIESNPTGGARLFEALIDETRGIADFKLYRASRSRVRAFVKQATRGGALQAVEAEPASVRALITRIAAVHSPDRPPPNAFKEWHARLETEAEPAATPGEVAAAHLTGEVTLAQRSRAAKMVREGSLGPWPPAREVLTELADRVSSQTEGKLVVSAATSRGRAGDAVAEAAKTLFSGDFAKVTAGRFEESAYVCWKSGREDDARACLAAASDLRGDAPEESPAALALVEVLLAPALESLKQNESEEQAPDSLLVRP